jgi:hypothetical protein
MLPATFSRGVVDSSGQVASQITAWGWQAALTSFTPLPRFVVASNVLFVAAAILVALRKRRSAIVCAAVALTSMIFGGFAVPRATESSRADAGRPSGPGILRVGALGSASHMDRLFSALGALALSWSTTGVTQLSDPLVPQPVAG